MARKRWLGVPRETECSYCGCNDKKYWQARVILDQPYRHAEISACEKCGFKEEINVYGHGGVYRLPLLMPFGQRPPFKSMFD